MIFHFETTFQHLCAPLKRDFFAQLSSLNVPSASFNTKPPREAEGGPRGGAALHSQQLFKETPIAPFPEAGNKIREATGGIEHLG